MNWGKALSIVVIALALFFGGYYLGTTSVEPIVEERVSIDTIYYEKPTIAKVGARPITVRLPRLIFAEDVKENNSPNITHTESKPLIIKDSVDVKIDIETVIYEDTTYRAQISGPRIGQYGPQLDWVQSYQQTITQTATKRSRFAVTAGVGVGLTPAGIQPMVGVSAGIILWQK
jgi:hypothetical protein